MSIHYFASRHQSPAPSGLSLRSGNLQKKLGLEMQQPVSASSSSKRAPELKRATGKTPNAEQILRRLESVADYDPERGGFIVHTQPAYSWSDKVGKRLASQHGDGYWGISLANKTWRQSRLVWLWHHGSWPEFSIDHSNGDTSDDRIENLCDVPQRLNCCNRKLSSNNKTGINGICFASRRNKYIVLVQHKGKRVEVGRFNILPAAARALAAYHKKHPELGYTARHLQSLHDYLATLPTPKRVK